MKELQTLGGGLVVALEAGCWLIEVISAWKLIM